jgi:hypothetical protein
VPGINNVGDMCDFDNAHLMGFLNNIFMQVDVIEPLQEIGKVKSTVDLLFS